MGSLLTQKLASLCGIHGVHERWKLEVRWKGEGKEGGGEEVDEGEKWEGEEGRGRWMKNRRGKGRREGESKIKNGREEGRSRKGM